MSFPRDAAAQKAILRIGAQKNTKSLVEIIPCEIEVEILDGKADAPDYWKELGWRKENTLEENNAAMKALQDAKEAPFTSGVDELKYIIMNSNFKPGHPAYIVAKAKLKKGYHTYGHKEGTGYINTKMDINLPDGFTLKEIQWPKAKMKKEGDYELPVYDKDFTVLIVINTPKTATAKESFDVSINTNFQYCNEFGCQLGNANHNIKLIAF